MPVFGPTGLVLRDVSGNGTHGTLQDMDPATDWVIGNNARLPGYTLNLDGSNDQVALGNPSILKPARFTIMAWAKLLSGHGTFPKLLAWNSDTIGWQLYLNTSGADKYEFRLGGLQIAGTNNTLDVWIHLAGTYDGANAKLYDNGVNTKTVATTTDPDYTGATRLDIGDRGTEARRWKGPVASVLIFNRALTANEVYEHYTDTLGMFCLSSQPYFSAPDVVAGRVMSSLAYRGGLAAEGGIAGIGGGLAG